MTLPSDIPGLAGWWKADSLALSDGAAVSSWADSSGGGHTAAQATGSLQPVYKTNIVNGKPVVRFDGVDDYLTATIVSDAQPTQWFLVFKAADSGVIRFLVASGQSILRHSSSDLMLINAPTDVWGTYTHSGAAWSVFTATFNGASSKLYMAGDAGQAVSTPGANTTGTGLTIGADGSLTRSWSGDIAEIVHYNRELNADERADVHTYLAAKYGLTAADDNTTSVRKVTDRGTLANVTTGTSSLVDLPAAASIATGDYLVARLALDNAGTSGAAVTVTVSDPRSNTWTVAGPATNTGASVTNAGSACYIAYTRVANAYSNGDDITFNYSATVPAKAIVVEEWARIHAVTPVAVSAVTATGTSATPSVSITPTTGGHVVYGALATEGPTGDTYTEDTDTTNGSWLSLTRLSTADATATNNQTLAGGYKRVTASGAQTWNPAITSRDWATLALVFAQAPLITVTVVAATTAIPAVTTSGAATAAPTVVQATTAVPSVSVLAASVTAPAFRLRKSPSGSRLRSGDVLRGVQATTPTPTVVAAISTIPSPTVQVSAQILPAVVAAVASVPAAVAKTGSTTFPAVVATAAAVPAPVLSSGSSISAAVVTAVAAVPAAVVTAVTQVSPSVVAAAATVAAVTVTTGATVLASPVAAVASVPAPALSTGSTVSASVVTTVASVPGGAVKTGSTVTVVSVTAVTAIPVPTVSASGNVTVAASVVAAAASVPSASTATGSTVTTSTVTAVAAIPAPAASGSATAAPPVVSVTTTVPVPALSTGAGVARPVVTATAGVPAVSVSAGTGSVVAASAVAATASVPPVSVSAGMRVSAVVVVATAAVPAPSVSADSGATATPTVVTAAAAVPAAVASGSARVSPAAVAVAASIPASVIRTSSVAATQAVAALAVIPGVLVTTPTLRPYSGTTARPGAGTTVRPLAGATLRP